MSKYPPPSFVEQNDFRNAWAEQVHYCVTKGLIIVANSKSERLVNTRDITGITVLTGNAITQIINKELHEKFPTKGLHLDKYIKTFTYKYMRDHMLLPENQRFKYLYIERLTTYPDGASCVDQIGRMYDKVRNDGINRQTEMITWQPGKDFPVNTPKGHDPPCLQRIWIRVLSEPVPSEGNAIGKINKGKVEVHLMWRSRDLYAAWMSNIVAVIYMIIEYILTDEYEIVKIVDFCNSLHIYESDWDDASLVKLMTVNPQMR